MAPISPLRRLPVAIVVKRGFVFAWESRMALAMPFLLYVGAALGLGLLVNLAGSGVVGGDIAVLLINLAISAAFAIPVHRFVLLGDARRGDAFVRGVAVYFAILAGLLAAAIILVAVAGAIFLQLNNQGQGIPGLGIVAGLLLGMIVIGLIGLFRLSLALPGAAVGQPDTVIVAWQASRGNGLRICAVIIFAVAPFLALQMILVAPLYSPVMAEVQAGNEIVELPQLGLATAVAWNLLSSLQVLVSLVALSLCYDWLVRGNGPVTAVGPA